MLSTDETTWMLKASRPTIWFDKLDHRFGQKRVSNAWTAALILFTVAEIVAAIFKGRINSYSAWPLVVMCTFALIILAIAVLPFFAERGHVDARKRRMIASHYSLRLLMSPAIIGDRHILWRYRKAIDKYAKENDLLVCDTVRAGADPCFSRLTYAERLRIQVAASELATEMGYGGKDFEDHIFMVDNDIRSHESQEEQRWFERWRSV